MCIMTGTRELAIPTPWTKLQLFGRGGKKRDGKWIMLVREVGPQRSKGTTVGGWDLEQRAKNRPERVAGRGRV
jgi:hypothetical protein